jgi:hypothetical protein
MLMIMAERYTEKKREETQGQQDILARLNQAKITKTEVSRQATTTQEMKSTVTLSICTDFFSACFEKAKKEGTAKEFNNTEMKQCFGR